MKETAKDFLTESVTCVAKKGDSVYLSERTGIAPIMQWMEKGIDLTGYEVADKIVGKAAAMLFKKAGIVEVYGATMSDSARRFFRDNGITYSYSTLTDKIINREGNDICPMEKTVLQIDDVDEAYEALKCTIARLKSAMQNE